MAGYSSTIYVFVPEETERIRYTFHLIFREILKVNFELITDRDDWDKYKQEVTLVYDYQPLETALHFVPHGLLRQKGINEFDIQTEDWDGLPIFFRVNDSTWPFDPFAASFFLASRYEEYWPHRKDKHGRFPASESVAFKRQFLHLPWINLVVDRLQKLIEERFPDFAFPSRSYQFLPTVDVDNAFAFLEKGMVRTLGALLRSAVTLDSEDLKNRISALLGMKKDPFDVFSELLDLQKQYGLKPIYFFLVGDYGINDKNVPISSRKFQALIKHIRDYAEVGLHPSYASSQDPDKLRMELKRLSQVIHSPVRISRNHFLKLQLPGSYRELLDAEIHTDYTMGFPDEYGFRASLCTPFSFYDLEMEQRTPLQVVPFCFMEATARFYKNQSVQEALAELEKLLEPIRQVDGQCCVLWHNDSLSETGDWVGWSGLLEEVIKKAHS
ncbi:polysaccharide deacetylase family protein [bacterium SCSIO 12741]|nr:polysaccharide deacetylase family protein [bacterium SCSIO 12741]